MSTQTASGPVKPSKWLMQQSKAAKAWLYLTVLLGLLAGGLIIIQAFLLAKIVQAAYIDRQPLAALWPYLMGMVVCFVGRAGLVWLKTVSGFQIGSHIRGQLRKALTQHIFDLGPAKLSNVASGGLTSTMIEQIEALQNFFARYLPQMSFAVMLPLIILVVVWPQNWLSGLMLLITAPLIPLFMALVGMGAAALNRKHFQALARLGSYFLDVLQGMSTIKLFHQGQAQIDKVQRASEDYRVKTMSVLKVAFLSSAVLEFFSSLAIALLATCLGLSLLGFMDWGTYSGHISLFSALFILLLAPEFYLPLKELGAYYHDRAEAIGAAEELLPLLQKTPVASGDTRLPEAFLAKPFSLAFDRVCFNYDSEQHAVLEDVSFEVKAGECVAIVGESGAGKSTLLQLLAGFLQPSSGRIALNHHEALFGYDLNSWRQAIGWLGQNPRLLPGTLRDNLKLAKPDASDEALFIALEKAHLAEFVRQLPAGLDTEVQEQSLGLSGGQAQRIALARMILKAAPLWLLDEPTASLDEASQNQVMGNIFQACRGATTLIVTHHLETIQKVDKVLVLDQGRVVQAGTFESLSSVEGVFRNLLSAKGGLLNA